ncbi:MAG: M3 family oligoendopeptidase [Bacteroidetes bacterium]|nr:M3 family oligoendopeptidase [Bacteroidota bacterium]
MKVHNPLRMQRKFLPETVSFDSWNEVEPLFRSLAERPVNSADDLKRWLEDINELESVFSEEMAWRYIRSSINTADAEAEQAYEFFVSEIEPNASPWFNRFNEIIDHSPYRDALDQSLYGVFLRSVRNDLTIYREANIPLFTEIDNIKQQYGRIAGAMSIEHEGKEITLQQAARLMQHTDRALRENVWRSIWQRRLQDREKFDQLFDQLCVLRQQVAANAGFANFRDYSFAAMGRFDYTPADCFAFHDAIAEEVMPLLVKLNEKRRAALGLTELRPWDLDVDTAGKPALHPFSNGNDLLKKTFESIQSVKPEYAGYLKQMDALGHFDLDSRIGKAPGGYNYPLPESGVPFIFMNATGSQQDVTTMVHEAGHAIHSFLMNALPLNALRNTPSEVAELASMSMEFISMEHWQPYYPTPEEYRRARLRQLEYALETLPWVAAVDAFQHWVYEHPAHSATDRAAAWKTIYSRFALPGINWDGLDIMFANNWQKQLHIFEMPFYYIEYGMAQLGAIAVWRNYRNDAQKGIDGYEKALRLGYTRPIGEIYAAANIRFDFSRSYVRELVHFVADEIDRLEH